jgi:hypothetical protein
MTFRRLVLLAPAAFLLHVFEEAPRFVAWTRLYPSVFSNTLSNTVFAVTNIVYMLIVVVAVVLCAFRSAVTLGLAVIAFLFSNALFHIAFTVFGDLLAGHGDGDPPLCPTDCRSFTVPQRGLGAVAERRRRRTGAVVANALLRITAMGLSSAHR